MSFYDELQSQFLKLVERHRLLEDEISVETRALKPVEAIGTPQRRDFPLLKGIVWYDVKDRNGDFRIRESARTTRAFKAFLKRVRAR